MLSILTAEQKQKQKNTRIFLEMVDVVIVA